MDYYMLSKQLSAAEGALAKLQEKERRIQRIRQQAPRDIDFSRDGDDFGIETLDSSPVSTLSQLVRLQVTADSLVLMQDYVDLLERWSKRDTENSENGDLESDIFAQNRLCIDLAENVLLRHAENVLEYCPPLYEEAYLPLFHYVHESLVAILRQELLYCRYPHPEGCATLLKQGVDSQLVKISHQLTHLERMHEQVVNSVEGAVGVSPNNSVMLELFHPLLDRVYFHFVNTGQRGDGSNGQIPLSATRIDNLPEWLLKYVREQIIGSEGDDEIRPFQVICQVDPLFAISFSEELIQLIEWVLVDQRDFFNDPAIAGPQSNPVYLFSAIQQFLEFDVALKEAVAAFSSFGRLCDDDINIKNSHDDNPFTASSSSFMGLMDTLVVSNSELMSWWIQRERESVFSTLFPVDESNAKKKIVPKPLANHVSPRAEIFCALIRSVQFKAATLTAPAKYLREVAVPLCSQFVEALHETSLDLRKLLVQKHLQTLELETQIVSNMHEWIEIVNGTLLAARVLLTKERTWHFEGGKSTMSSESDHDLARFGRSLERLAEVMVEEFAVAFVETILMERAKFASYLMMASHLLASEEWEAEELGNDLSVELQDTKVMLMYFQKVCNSIPGVSLASDDQSVSSEQYSQDNIAAFAPTRMRQHVMNRVAEKFLEVALDVNHVTPDIWYKGATIFAHDVNNVVGAFGGIPNVSRLLEVTKLLSLNFHATQGLFDALGGLVGSIAYLDVEEFTADARLIEEATSMLKAKDIHCPLEDAISILNRRRG